MSRKGHCLVDIAEHVRGCKREARAQATLISEIEHLRASAAMLVVAKPGRARAAEAVTALADERVGRLSRQTRRLLGDWLEPPGPTGVDSEQIVDWLMRDHVPGRLPPKADIPTDDPDRYPCIFPVGLGLKAMGDRVGQLSACRIGRRHPVCISSQPPAGFAADPIGELAAALACGFLVVEACLALGVAIDAVASDISFVFSDGPAAQYAVQGGVALRIWAVALRERYGADGRSQTLNGGQSRRGTFGTDELINLVEEQVLDGFVALANADGRARGGGF